MENVVTAVSYDLYIDTLEPIKVENNKLIILASTSQNKIQLLKFLKEKLCDAVKLYFQNVDDIIILDPSEKDSYIVENTEEQEASKPEISTGRNKLNEKYTFDTFVVGKSNQYVYAAARSVAENPGNKYNPLFIYGGVGLGKTHLLHAIGNYAVKHNKQLNVLYVTSEQFTNDYIQALKADKKENANKAFRDKYREVDILMIDDIQFIANRTGTQEEFFNTFNDLYQHNKQIVISSDKHPRNIETLEERLRSRFSGGIIQDIQRPDFETRLAILQKKVEQENYNVDDEALSFLAENIDTNIRELEGGLNNVILLSSLMGKDKATIDEARETLKDMEFTSSVKVTADKILDNCCEYYSISKGDILGKKKTKEIVIPRQMCMYLITELLDMPLASIGEIFGRDHSTVMHARDKISDNIKKNKDMEHDFKELMSIIKK